MIDSLKKVAYRGREGCQDVRCTQIDFARRQGMCWGWHCADCDEPCSSQGHECATPDHPKWEYTAW